MSPLYTNLSSPVYGGEARPAKPVKSVQWTDLSAERRELRRAAGRGPRRPSFFYERSELEKLVLAEGGGGGGGIVLADRDTPSVVASQRHLPRSRGRKERVRASL